MKYHDSYEEVDQPSCCLNKRPKAIDLTGSGPNISLMHAIRRSFRFMQLSPIFFDPDFFAMQITATSRYRAHAEQSMSFVACSLLAAQNISSNGLEAINCLLPLDVAIAVAVF